MKRQWYYRGSLKSCNYSCSYCPFSKKRGSDRERQADKEALFRFIERINGQQEFGGAVQIVPYGEALVHSYYWEGLARLSQNPELDAVGAQSNFSFPVERMVSVFCSHGGNADKLRLWGTFHPEMTTVEQFVEQCRRLTTKGISFCVGAVGVPGQLETIRQLRESLPPSVYLWINKMDGLRRAYTNKEIEAFLEIDEYFELELLHHKADAALCGDNRFVEADGTMRRCNRCRQRLGNLYDGWTEKERASVPEETGRYCSRKECDCYLSYCNRKEEQLLFFQPYPAFRIPSYPKALFLDVDGTLIPEGQNQIPSKYVKWLSRLAAHSHIYLATSLPYEIARRKASPVWQVLRGGVFGGGGRRMVWGDGGQGKREVLLDEICQLETEWLSGAERKGRKYGFTLHTYKKKGCVYKVTLVFRRGRLPQQCSESYRRKLARDLNIPDSCQLVREGNGIQIIRKDTGKLEGIQSICKEMGYDEEEVAVAGNSENDIPMLQYFPFSIAAKGSSDWVKECARVKIE